MADNISIRQGETLELNIIIDDPHAVEVKLLVGDDDGTIIESVGMFATIDGETSATITVPAAQTNQDVGEYEYMLMITYDDGVIEKLPDGDCCDEDCGLPTFSICKSLSEGVS
jgi:hypothetical protein